MTDDLKRCGFCAIIGAPNAGKSTLVNQLTGSKVSIVSHKVQTTRARLRAIVMAGNTQIVLVDTPGIFNPKRKLDEAMVGNAWGGAGEADAVALLVDGRKGAGEDFQRLVEGLKKARLKAMLVINKIDLIKREELLALSAKLNEAYPFTETFMVSALNGSGVEDLRNGNGCKNAGRRMALPGRPGGRCAIAFHGRRNHPRETLRAAA